jgi:hypothetical protein
MDFALPPTGTPSRALRSFFQGPTVCECHSLIIAVYYQAILNYLGDAWFDACFPDMAIQNKNNYDGGKNPMKGVLANFEVMADESNVKAGDWVYVRNRSDYKKRHPKGAAGGWNLVCVETGPPRKYIGFGLTPNPTRASDRTVTPLTLEQIFQILLDEHNKEPTQEDLAAMDPLDKRLMLMSKDKSKGRGMAALGLEEKEKPKTEALRFTKDPNIEVASFAGIRPKRRTEGKVATNTGVLERRPSEQVHIPSKEEPYLDTAIDGQRLDPTKLRAALEKKLFS